MNAIPLDRLSGQSYDQGEQMSYAQAREIAARYGAVPQRISSGSVDLNAPAEAMTGVWGIPTEAGFVPISSTMTPAEQWRGGSGSTVNTSGSPTITGSVGTSRPNTVDGYAAVPPSLRNPNTVAGPVTAQGQAPTLAPAPSMAPPPSASILPNPAQAAMAPASYNTYMPSVASGNRTITGTVSAPNGYNTYMPAIQNQSPNGAGGITINVGTPATGNPPYPYGDPLSGQRMPRAVYGTTGDMPPLPQYQEPDRSIGITDYAQAQRDTNYMQGSMQPQGMYNTMAAGVPFPNSPLNPGYSPAPAYNAQFVTNPNYAPGPQYPGGANILDIQRQQNMNSMFTPAIGPMSGPSAMSNQSYPYNPNFPGPSLLPGSPNNPNYRPSPLLPFNEIVNNRLRANPGMPVIGAPYR